MYKLYIYLIHYILFKIFFEFKKTYFGSYNAHSPIYRYTTTPCHGHGGPAYSGIT